MVKTLFPRRENYFLQSQVFLGDMKRRVSVQMGIKKEVAGDVDDASNQGASLWSLLHMGSLRSLFSLLHNMHVLGTETGSTGGEGGSMYPKENRNLSSERGMPRSKQ